MTSLSCDVAEAMRRFCVTTIPVWILVVAIGCAISAYGLWRVDRSSGYEIDLVPPAIFFLGIFVALLAVAWRVGVWMGGGA